MLQEEISHGKNLYSIFFNKITAELLNMTCFDTIYLFC